MESNGLNRFFRTVTTSEEAEAKKPSHRIFNYAMRKAGAKPGESLMIGDDYDVDILGAKNVGMDQMLFLYNGAEGEYDCTYIINHLEEILSIL